jgi:light-regulated signal transduction histidine kinase (bacteriophytochrome)
MHTEGGTLVISTIRDISERKAAEERIRQLNAELEARVAARTSELSRSNEELQQFVYVASHDLQEPLRSVSSYTQLLARKFHDVLNEDAQQYVEFIVEGVTRMHDLINDLLTYSRAGSREQEIAEVDCSAVLRHATRNLRAAIHESGARITNDPLPVLRADGMQLSIVLQNLIANAIKYQAGQPPEIHVGANRTRNEWVLWVRDNGIGIEREYHQRIFMPFKRLHGREYPGTGIGLAICKKIVERHQGRIWVESESGRGSTFLLSIPDRV